jgi:hypothetical protein
LVEALRLAAPQTGIENDGLYSDWQIKPANIPRWSRQCIGRELTPTQFESSPVTARAILVCVMGDILREQYQASGQNESLAVRRTASWWMTGDPSQYDNAPTNSYTQKVLSFYQQQSNNPQPQPPAASAPPPAQSPTPAPPSHEVTGLLRLGGSLPNTPGQPTASSSSTAQISENQVGALVEALRLAAPQTGTVNDGLYSDWQIKPANIPRWSRQCIGRELTPTQFESSPVTARTILVCVMGDIFREQYQASGQNESLAVRRTASWWMTGDPSQYNNGAIASYTQRVLDFYQQSGS